MRISVKFSCTAITCAGAAVATASCFNSSSGGNGPTTSFDSGVDSSFPDASMPEDSSVDTATPPADAGADTTVAVVDSGHDAAPEPGCAPGNVSGFQVPPYVHANPQQLDCIANFDNHEDYWFAQQCFSDAATLETCAAFASSGYPDAGPEGGPVIQEPSCGPCLLTPQITDAGWGPGVQGTIVVPNLAGCIELADESDAGLSCAMAVQAASACVDFACKTACPVSDDPSRLAYIACTQTAATTVCNSYTQAAQACIAAEIGDSGTSQVQANCFSSTDPTTQYGNLAAFFCST
jgi:hypothetical protein